VGLVFRLVPAHRGGHFRVPSNGPIGTNGEAPKQDLGLSQYSDQEFGFFMTSRT